MIKLSELPNFWVKLSGLPTYCHPSGSKIDDVKPYSDTVLELFGPSRMVWGGDWPVIDVGGGLANWVNITTELLSGLSADERQLIGTLNAKQVYLGKR
jgi:predicted TIM-barrel fold metal-dependent hydrolase